MFILKEAFGYSHHENADVLSGSEEKSRQLLSRGKSKLSSSKSNSKNLGSDMVPEGIFDRYISAIRGRDTAMLEKLLSDDMTFFADGGDKVQVAKERCAGYSEVSKLLFFVYQKFQASYKISNAIINHQPHCFIIGTQLVICQIFDILQSNSKIERYSSIVDPDKLKNIHHMEENNNLMGST